MMVFVDNHLGRVIVHWSFSSRFIRKTQYKNASEEPFFFFSFLIITFSFLFLISIASPFRELLVEVVYSSPQNYCENFFSK